MSAPSVLMLSAGFWPALGGAERQALELSRALIARGASVRVLTRRLDGLPETELVRGVSVRRLPVLGRGALDSLSFMLGALAWLLKHGAEYDAIHVHLAGSPALAAALAGAWLGKPVLVKLGGGRGIGELAASSRTALGRLKLRALSSLRPRFIAVAEDLAEEARELLGPVEIEVLSNGVDTERFRPVSPERKRALRRGLGWPLEGPIFLYTGRLSPEKRLPWFCRLWLEAVGDGPAVLVLVGDGPERPELESAAAASAGRVRLLAAVDDTAPLCAAADVFLLPSTSEGLSNSLLEAMSSGLAVLASRVGGTPEAVEDKHSGLLFARDDAEEAKAALRRLLAESELVQKLGVAARESVERSRSMGRVADRLERLYRGEP